MDNFKAFSKNSLYLITGIYVIFIFSNVFLNSTFSLWGYIIVYVFLLLHLPLTIAFFLIFFSDVIRRRPLLKYLRKEVVWLFVSLIILMILYISLSYCNACEF